MSRLLRWAVVLACSALSACASLAPGDPRIWDVRSGRFISEPQLVAELAAARYRLLGEVHDSPAHHDIRARLITAMAAAGVRPAVVFEQLDLDHDADLLAAQREGADAEQLADAGRLDRRAWGWPLHKPIVEAALAARLPVRAGNLPRAQLRNSEPDANAAWYARLQAAAWTGAQAAALREHIVDGHCGRLPDAVVPRLVQAQRMRDAAMAQALVDDATADGAILIAGNEHVRADLAVPLYLNGTRTLGLGLVEASAEEERAADFPRQVVAAYPGFDFVWLTPSLARDDACARFGLR
jgi:uncharacterized iron-regulated protein